ncbi:unnamed protein product [Somion occarium]|uniref:Uncharacterized protein n=1 Tax=Somion occarium TaxID=3059160 RepID=A0ABP1DB85_9APHY
MSTSTATILEPYDSHMHDFQGDTDIPMFTGSIMADTTWTSVEDTMDDDSSNSQSQSEPVEIEMETNEGYVQEYEMTDYQDGVPQDGDQDLPDIEFTDEHQAASPSMPGFDTTVALSAEPSLFLDPPSMMHSALPSPSIPQAELSAPPVENDWSLTNHTVHEVYVESEPVAVQAIYSASSEPQESTSAISPVFPAPELSGDAADAAPSHEAEAPPQEVVSGNTEGEATTGLEAPPVSDIERFAQEAESTTTVAGHVQKEDSVANSDAADSTAEPTTLAVEQVDSEQQEYAYEDYEETQEVASSGDPHEISAGVYIDPPPAVLLEVSYATERLELCLFNQPTPGSGSQTPTAEAPVELHQTFTLLLHDRPTLYYEPLSDVFAALRADEVVNSIPELSEGELVLDAYDLQLVASEDNMYMHEVTLHELNILHDDAHLSGPLRLRLYPRSPRFITRFHTLRDQIDRLAIGEVEQEDLYSELPAIAEEQLLEEQRPISPTDAQARALPAETPSSEEYTENAQPGEPQVDLESQEYQAPEEDRQEYDIDNGVAVALERLDEQEEVDNEGETNREDTEQGTYPEFDENAEYDGAVADDTTEGTEIGDVSHESRVEEREEETPTNVDLDTTAEHLDEAAQPEGAESTTGFAAEISEHGEEGDERDHGELESGEIFEYATNETADTAEPRKDTESGYEDTSIPLQESTIAVLEKDETFEGVVTSEDTAVTQAETAERDSEFQKPVSEPLVEEAWADENNHEGSHLVQHELTPKKSTDTLASRVSKRSYDLVEPDFEDYDGEDDPSLSLPDTKRLRSA